MFNSFTDFGHFQSLIVIETLHKWRFGLFSIQNKTEKNITNLKYSARCYAVMCERDNKHRKKNHEQIPTIFFCFEFQKLWQKCFRFEEVTV